MSLYKPAIVAIVDAKWREWLNDGSLAYSKLPQYRDEWFRGSPHQLAHRDWVSLWFASERIQNIRSKIVFQERLLPQARALEEFGPDVAARARSIAEGETPIPREALSDHDFEPACFALPHAFD